MAFLKTLAAVLAVASMACAGPSNKPAPAQPAENPPPAAKAAPAAEAGSYEAEVQQFQHDREAALTTDTGWLTIAGLFFVNNLMMYTNTPSQEASEAFLKYYLGQIHTYWQSPVGVAVPVLKSIAKADYYAKDPNQVAIVDKWMPVCKTYAAKKTQSFAALAAVDGGQPLAQFAQAMLQGKTDPKAALTTLQQGLESIVKR